MTFKRLVWILIALAIIALIALPKMFGHKDSTVGMPSKKGAGKGGAVRDEIFVYLYNPSCTGYCYF